MFSFKAHQICQEVFDSLVRLAIRWHRSPKAWEEDAKKFMGWSWGLRGGNGHAHTKNCCTAQIGERKSRIYPWDIIDRRNENDQSVTKSGEPLRGKLAIWRTRHDSNV